MQQSGLILRTSAHFMRCSWPERNTPGSPGPRVAAKRTLPRQVSHVTPSAIARRASAAEAAATSMMSVTRTSRGVEVIRSCNMSRRLRVPGYRAASIWAPLAWGVGALGGCAELADPGDTYNCFSLGTCSEAPPDAPAPSRWDCLDDADPERPEEAAGRVRYELPIVNYTSQLPAQGLQIQSCSKTDTTCQSGPVVPVEGMGAGGVQVPLERSFGRNNYLKVQSTDVEGTIPIDVNMDGVMPDPDFYIPYAYYFGDTVYGDRRIEPDFQLLRLSDVLRVAGTANISIDPARALLIVRAYDCNDEPAPGVTFDIDYAGDDGGDLPQPYTVRGGLPFPPPSREQFLPTDDDGQGGFANVPFGSVSVSASIDGVSFGPPGGVTATAAPGQITAVEVHARIYGMPQEPAESE